ncbi:MAG: exodeoxyribonuclease VII large subunit [Pedosphaera sp.]|nr:exodeoxyribonuclease VII large subunit [Pedosphaera sp.]
MSKITKSQWDFGELFSPEALRQVLTVSELTTSVKRLLEREIGQIWVTGEITNLRIQSSGHVYFSLKDSIAQLSCVLFRGEARTINRDLLADGQKVVLQGEITVYEARGQYQLRVVTVELQGVGALQIAFEKLKQKLNAEGLFAAERKRPLPLYPQRIGVVTSATAAALRDVIHVIERRNPSLEIVLASCRVQGPGAADEIACAIRLLDEWSQTKEPGHGIDLILLTRGGGSLEDLWAFNEEVVARAIFESKLPIISAVGHEIDFTISDFVADLRAATPSVAAELITEGVFASRDFIAGAAAHMRRLVRDRLDTNQEGLRRLLRQLQRAHPRRRLQENAQRLDDLESSLSRCARYSYRRQDAVWQAVSARLLRVKPAQAVLRRRQSLERAVSRFGEHVRLHLKGLGTRLAAVESRLRLLSPSNVLERGYSITTDEITGRVIRSAAEVQPGQSLKTRLKSGEIRSVASR